MTNKVKYFPHLTVSNGRITGGSMVAGSYTIPNNPISGFRLITPPKFKPLVMVVTDPRIPKSCNELVTHVADLNISRGEVLDPMVYGITSLGTPVVGLRHKMQTNKILVKLTDAAVMHHVALINRKDVVTYLGRMQKIDARKNSASTDATSCFVFRTSSGVVFTSTKPIVKKILRTKDAGEQPKTIMMQVSGKSYLLSTRIKVKLKFNVVEPHEPNAIHALHVGDDEVYLHQIFKEYQILNSKGAIITSRKITKSLVPRYFTISRLVKTSDGVVEI